MSSVERQFMIKLCLLWKFGWFAFWHCAKWNKPCCDFFKFFDYWHCFVWKILLSSCVVKTFLKQKIVWVFWEILCYRVTELLPSKSIIYNATKITSSVIEASHVIFNCLWLFIYIGSTLCAFEGVMLWRKLWWVFCRVNLHIRRARFSSGLPKSLLVNQFQVRKKHQSRRAAMKRRISRSVVNLCFWQNERGQYYSLIDPAFLLQRRCPVPLQ